QVLGGGVAGDVVGALVEDDGGQAGAAQDVVVEAEDRRGPVAAGEDDAVAGDAFVGDGGRAVAVQRLQPRRQHVGPAVVLIGGDGAVRPAGAAAAVGDRVTQGD